MVDADNAGAITFDGVRLNTFSFIVEVDEALDVKSREDELYEGGVAIDVLATPGHVIDISGESNDDDALAALQAKLGTVGTLICRGTVYTNCKLVTPFPTSRTNDSDLIGFSCHFKQVTAAVPLVEIQDALDDVLAIFGTPKLLCPYSEIAGTSITDQSGLSNTLTASASVSTFRGLQGYATYYNLDGTSQYLYRADDSDFSFGNGATDTPFSVVIAVSPDDVISREILGKWDETSGAEKMEWRLFFDSGGHLMFELVDQSGWSFIGRRCSAAAFPTTPNLWPIIIATYDGSGTSAGCKLYIDGARVDDTDAASGAYIAMENLTGALYIGATKEPATTMGRFFKGKFTWPGIAAKELSPTEALSVTQIIQGVLAI